MESNKGATCDAVKDHLLQGHASVEVQTQYADDKRLGFNGTWAYRNAAQVTAAHGSQATHARPPEMSDPRTHPRHRTP